MWVLGEKKFVYTIVSGSSAVPITVTTASYFAYDLYTEETVASGVASIDGALIYSLWEPEETGVYVFEFAYTVGAEKLNSRQIIEVRETI